MATLYRKYRPQSFAEVVGQQHIKITLEHEIKADKLAHAYLFCGPRAVGKTTLARVLAKAINCQARPETEANPCNQCQSCKEITDGRAFDVIEIDAASHTGIDNVRENIIASSRIAPTSLKYKVFIIDEAHMLSGASFNALLKTLEEPPAHVIFILCTTETHKLPETIISRCQRFDFKKIGVSDVVRKLNYILKLEEIAVDQRVLEAIARHSGGHMRDAESLLGQVLSVAGDPESLAGKEITLEEAELIIPRSNLTEAVELLEILSRKDTTTAIGLINQLLNDGIDLKIFINETIELWRRLILIKINPDLISRLGLDLGETISEKLASIVKDLNLSWLVFGIQKLLQVPENMKFSQITQLPLELALIEICIFDNSTKVNASIKPVEIINASVKNAINFEDNKAITPTTAVNLEKPVVAMAVNVNQDKSQVPVVSLEDIRSKWTSFVEAIKADNYSLSFVLKACQPQAVMGNVLVLAFTHKFHQTRLSQPSIKTAAENALYKIYGSQLIIEATVDENLVLTDDNSSEAVVSNINLDNNLVIDNNIKVPEVSNQGDDTINNLLKTFGGKVIG